MESKTKFAYSFISIMSLSLLTVVSVFTTTQKEPVFRVEGDGSKTTTVTQEMLDKTVLENFALKEGSESDERQQDSKFRIDLEDGNYILGAIVYRDCNEQFVGDYLGDRMGMHNFSGSDQPYNFNIIFSFEKNVESLSVDYTVGLEDKVVDENVKSTTIHSQVKCGDISSTNGFYEKIKDVPYERLTLLMNSTNPWADQQPFYADSRSYSERDKVVTESADVQDTVSCTFYESYTQTVAAVQFTYRGLDKLQTGTWIRFKLNSLTFKYTCN